MKSFYRLFLFFVIVLFSSINLFAKVTSVTITKKDLTCNGSDDGEAYVSALTSTGTGPYSYEWKGTIDNVANNTVNRDTLKNLGAGFYTVRVIDSSDNTKSSPFQFQIVDQPPLGSSTDQMQSTCFGSCDGIAWIDGFGGTGFGTYLFEWDDPASSTTDTIKNLCAGDYNVTLTDGNGCTTTDVVTVTEPPLLQPNVDTTNVLCNGESTGSATANPISNAGGPFMYDWGPDPINGDLTNSITDLSAGTYTVTVTDKDGCSNTQTFIIEEPTALDLDLSKVDADCFEDNSGSITTTISGGTANYTFEWRDGPTDQNRAAIVAGKYVLTVTDDNGCQAIDSIEVGEKPEINVSFSTIDVLCNGQSTGEVTATISGGTPNYSFDWSNGPSGNLNSDPRVTTISGLTAATYTITITDNLGCQKVDSAIIIENTPIIITLDDSIPPTCFNGDDGRLSISVSGGDPNPLPNEYTYAWSNLDITQDIIGLDADTYTVTVTDASNCTQTRTIILPNPDPIVPNVFTDSVSCIGGNDGKANVNAATGGRPPYTYDWGPNPINGDLTSSVTDLSIGTYTVTVTDADNCQQTETFTIDEPASGISISLTSTIVACFGKSTGSITNNVSGGSPDYTFLWDDGITTTQDRSGIPANTYTVTVTDKNGCTNAESIIVGENPELTISFATQQLLCNGDNDGEITATITGGTTDYSFDWSNGPSGNLNSDPRVTTIDNLIAGTYTITITDALGCEKIDSAVIIDLDPIEIVLDNKRDLLCNGDADGFINISVSGGTPNPAPNEYTYLWSNTDFTEDISNLIANTYTVTVTDANNCTKTFETTLAEPDPLTVVIDSVRGVSCNGLSDGFISAVASGGASPYRYDWPLNPNSRTHNNIVANTYEVTVTDNNGCTITATDVVSQPQTLVATITRSGDPLCAGVDNGFVVVQASGGTASYNYNWEPGNPSGDGTDTIKNLTGDFYTVTITDANGCTDSASVTLIQPTALTLTTDQENVSCNGESTGKAWVTASGGTNPYNYKWDAAAADQITDTARNLTAGTYSVIVTDNNGCDDTTSVTISEPLTALAVNTTSSIDPKCDNSNDGEAIATPSGGTPPYSYQWDAAANSSTDQNSAGLGAGTYMVTVTDFNGCTILGTANLTAPLPISITGVVTDVACFGANTGAIDITASDGTPGYTYDWGTGITSEDRTDLIAGTYTVKVTDLNNCEFSRSFTVGQPSSALTSIPDTSSLTCNGDTDGITSITVSGGDMPYFYNWEGSPTGNGNDTITNLIAGKYKVTITDDNNCSIVDSAFVIEPTLVSVTPVSIINSNCDNSTRGSAFVTASGGTGNLTYTWGPGNPDGQGTDSIFNLLPGNYSLTVIDANSCDSIQNFTIETDGANFTFEDSTIIDSCNGGGLGFVGIFNISGGLSPYTYLWDDPDASTTSSVDSLLAGTYNVTITDANGCDSTLQLEITQPTAITASVATLAESCFPGDDGEATVAVVGGTLFGTNDYTYEWEEGGSAINRKDDYEAGDYKVTITDDYGCSIVEDFTIQAQAPFNVAEVIDNVTCFGEDDGKIDLTVTPAILPYTFEWENGDVTEDRDNLIPGITYKVTVTGLLGCTETHEYTISEPAELTATVATRGESCNPGGDGQAIVTVSGGTLDYTYDWDNGASSNDTNDTYSAGLHEVTITDRNGCDTTIQFTISSAANYTVDLDSTDVNCNGSSTGEILVTTTAVNPTFAWSDNTLSGSNPTGIEAGTYTVTITDNNNCVKIDSITINQPDSIISISNKTDESCIPGGDGTISLTVTGGTVASGSDYTYNWQDIGVGSNIRSNLDPNTYIVTISDDNLCSINDTIIIETAIAPTIVLDSLANVLCKDSANGYIEVSASGGISPYTFNWGDILNPTAVRSGLEDDTYEVTLTDQNGCTDTRSFVISEPAAALKIDFNRIDVFCFGEETGSIDLTISGGTQFSDPDSLYKFEWSDNSILEDRFNIGAGDYSVTITDSNGCVASRLFTIGTRQEIKLDFDTINIICSGASTGRLEVTASNGVAPYTYAWSNGSPSRIISNQPAGIYRITVTDDNGCQKIDSAEITEPNPIDPRAIVTDENCNPGSDGFIDVSQTIGGTAPYTYLWNDGTDADTLANLTAKTYSLTITDANSCEEIFSFVVGSGANITSNEVIDSVSCFGSCDGSIKLAPSGGVAPYTYTWPIIINPANISIDSAFNLCIGAYEVTITDAANCVKIETFTVEGPTEILPNLATTDETCDLDSNGTASVKKASGGDPGYTYRWSTGETGDSISNLPAGNYEIIIFDSKGCSDTTQFTIGSGNKIVGNGVVDSVNCFGESSGEIVLLPSGGAVPYTYQWGPPGNQTSQFIDNQFAGTYTVTISDDESCSTVESYRIDEPSEMTATFRINNESCSPGNDGNAVVIVSGGTLTTGYRYVWSAGTTFTDSVADLTANNYDVSVTDNKGCEKIFPFTINSGDEIVLNDSVFDLSCFGICVGQIGLGPTGGTGPYTYLWSNNVTNTSFDGDTALGLCADNYSVTVIDATGCSKSENFIVGQPTVLDLTVQTIAESCNPGGDGIAVAEATGGTTVTGDYTYTWSVVNPLTDSLKNLGEGTYSVTVEDDNGCTTSREFNIGTGVEILANEIITNAPCFEEATGRISVAPSGGTAGYNYNWNSTVSVAQGQGTDTARLLSAGTYTITITDALGCSSSKEFVVGEGDEILPRLNIFDESCIPGNDGIASAFPAIGGTQPLIYEWSTGDSGIKSISGLSAGNYDITLTDDLGCIKIEPFIINSGNNLVITEDITDPLCFGDQTGSIALSTSGGQAPYTYAWENKVQDFTDITVRDTAILLGADIYSVTIADNTGCSTTRSYNVNQPTELQIVRFDNDDESCSPGDDGVARAIVTGGTVASSYTFAWENKPSTTSIQTGYGAGTFSVTVTDDNGCSIIESFSIGTGNNIIPNEFISEVNCNGEGNGFIALTPSGGQFPYSFIWDNQVTVTSVDGDTAKALKAGTYQVTITDDNSCSKVESYTVTQPSKISANVITVNASCNPGGDGRASVSGFGGTGTLSFEWSIGGNTSSKSNLSVGSYDVTITDRNGCDTIIDFEISSGAEIFANGTPFNLECNGVCDGRIALNPSGGQRPYSFNWDTKVLTTSLNGDTAKLLCADDYTVTITDNRGCSKISTFTIDQPDPFQANLILEDASCTPGGDGSADASAAIGGTGSLSYQWSTTPILTTSSISNLAANSYTLTITDARGCDTIIDFDINSGANFNVVEVITDVDCFGDSTGEISLTTSGGSSPYTYAWDANVKVGQLTAIAEKLKANSYTVTISDATGCSTTENYTVDQSSKILASITTVDASCDPGGDGSVSASVSGGTSSNGVYNFTWPNAGVTTINSDNNLNEGPYDVIIEDDEGCKVTESFNIGKAGTSFNLSIAKTDISCFGKDDGSITVTVSGGTSPFTYDWPGGTPNSPTKNNLSANTYTITVTDATGCSNTISETIIEPSVLSSTFSTANSTCDVCSGSITASPSGGTGTISIEWLNNLKMSISQSGTQASNLCAGFYFAALEDANGCVDTIQVLVEDFGAPTASIDSIDESCLNNCDGKAYVTSSCLLTTCTVNWTDVLGNNLGTNDTIKNLCPGTYFANVTDVVTGCQTNLQVVVNAGNSITPNLIIQGDGCGPISVCQGNAKVTPTGGVAPYTYEWDGPSGAPTGNLTDSISSLCAGSYTVTITDANLCDTIVNFEVTRAIILPNEIIQGESCNGNLDGSIELFPSGGANPYTYNWSGNTNGGNVSSQFSLSAGTYTVTITGANQCDTILEVNLGTSAFSYTLSKTDIGCNSANDGTADITITGGSVGFSFNWDPTPAVGQNTANISSLSAQKYFVTITDQNSCSTTDSITITQDASIEANIITEDLVCGNICDGKAYATPVNGTTPYLYEWSPSPINGQFTDTVSQLCSGNYTITVTDAAGCTTEESFSIGGPVAITASFATINPSCNLIDGSITVTAAGGDGNYSYEWFDAAFNLLTSTSTTLSPVGSGVYYSDITDGSSCKERFNINLNDDGSEVLTVTSSNVNCFDGNDGEAEVNFTCSDPNCSVEWFNTTTGVSLGITTNKVSNLKAGKYYVQVINNSGCKSFEDVEILQPTEYAVSASITDASCENGCNGAISVSVSGSNGGYSFNWGPGPLVGQGTNSISNLCSGTYNLTLSDANSCDTIITYFVSEPSRIRAQFSSIEANCGRSDGSITALVSGGTVSANYDLQWFDGFNNLLVGQTNLTINNISAGDYDLRVIDDNQCEERITTVLSNINGPTVTIDSVRNSGCSEENNGGIFITASGPNAPYSYNWLSKGQTSEDITNLSEGTYAIKVTDALGCITTEDTSITEFPKIDALITTEDANCGLCDGKASILPNGRIVPYSYLWSNGSTADTAANLCGGLYSVVVTDGNGCTESFNFAINTDGGPTGETVTAIATSCATSCDGSVTVTPSGGILPYTYLWQHNGATTNNLDNLCKGIYFLQISDAKGCSRNVQVNIESPNELTIDEKVTAVACGGTTCDGSILLNVKGGNKPYSYDWAPLAQADTNFIDDLCAGVYNVTVSDLNGCSKTKTIVVSNTNNPVSANPTVEEASCFGVCDASLISNVTISNDISFTWLNDQGQSVARPNTDLINTACAGTYILQITSISTGCIYYETVEVEEPDSISLSAAIVKNITCAGECDAEVFVSVIGGEILYSYTWNDPSQQSEIPAVGLCAGTYTITATDANGCNASTSVVLVDPPQLNVSITNSTNLNCSSDCDATATVAGNGGSPPYTFSWSGGQTGDSPTNLCFGMNIVTLTDVTGCSKMDTVFISAIDTVIAEVGIVLPVCEGDSIRLSGSTVGSTVTSSAWYFDDATTLLTNSSDTLLFRNIGTYTYFFIATNGSCSDTAEFKVPVVTNPEVGVPSSIAIFKDEIASFKVSNQDVSYSYSWTPHTALNNASIAEPISSVRETTTYTLTVTDTNNCIYIDSLEVIYSPDIKVPSGISPNGDGTNDVWNIGFLAEFPNATVQIYNRWGELIFEEKNGYKTPWDGTYEGKALPVGTYYYVIDFRTERFKPITGPITIVK